MTTGSRIIARRLLIIPHKRVEAATVVMTEAAFLCRGVIEVTKNLVTLKIPSQSGVQETTLYDLTVFNYLVMRLDTDQAWEKKAKFNDVLIKHETQAQPELTYIRGLFLCSKRAKLTRLTSANLSDVTLNPLNFKGFSFFFGFHGAALRLVIFCVLRCAHQRQGTQTEAFERLTT